MDKCWLLTHVYAVRLGYLKGEPFVVVKRNNTHGTFEAPDQKQSRPLQMFRAESSAAAKCILGGDRTLAVFVALKGLFLNIYSSLSVDNRIKACKYVSNRRTKAFVLQHCLNELLRMNLTMWTHPGESVARYMGGVEVASWSGLCWAVVHL